jgi:hypothetical protein
MYSAGAGSINLTTGVFTRTGPAVNQLVIYGLDATITTTALATPAVVESLLPTPDTRPARSSSRSAPAALVCDPDVPTPAEIEAGQSLPPELRYE